MLFLLNDKVIEITAPEAHLMQRWREIGCGDPRLLRAQAAVEFAVKHFLAGQASASSDLLAVELDIAALIIAKTGANSLILKPTPAGAFEPRLRDVPNLVLETYQRGAANDRDVRAQA